MYFTQVSITIYITLGLLITAIGLISLSSERYGPLEDIKNISDPILRLMFVVITTAITVVFWLPAIVLSSINDK